MTTTLSRPRIRLNKSLRRNPLVAGRSRKVRAYARKVRARVKAVMSRHGREAARRVRQGRDPIPDDYNTRWVAEWIGAQRKLLYNIAAEGMGQARMELGLEKQLQYAEDNLAIVEQNSDFVLEPVENNVDEWLNEVAGDTTKNHAKNINKIHREAMEYWDPELQQGKTVVQMAEQIEKLDKAYVHHRARMIAVTNANWSFNAGIKTQYSQLGINAFEWFTSKDDSTCPFCAAMDGVVVGGSDPFWAAGSQMGAVVDEHGNLVPGATEAGEGQKLRRLNLKYEIGHPPLHPNCACDLLAIGSTG